MGPWRARVLGVTTWMLAAVAVASLAQATGFRFKDGDSALYARIAADLAQQPLSTWLSPQWPPNEFKTGLFQEHMAVFFWPAALIGMLGIPEIPAALLANLGFLGLLLLVLAALSRRLHGPDTPEAAVIAWIASMIGVLYIIRHNHEVPLALGVASALLGLLESNRGARFMVLGAAGAAWCVAMKGIVGVVVFPALVAWGVLVVPGRSTWLALGASGTAMLAFLIGHDAAFAAVNGHSFLGAYVGIHVGYAQDKETKDALSKLTNVAYYAGAITYWFLPWSLPLLLGLVRRARARVRLEPAQKAALATLIIHILFFSVFDRRASRYIFGVYPVLAVTTVPVIRTLLARLPAFYGRARAGLPAALAITVLVISSARIWVHNHHYSFFSWNADRSKMTVRGDAGPADVRGSALPDGG